MAELPLRCLLGKRCTLAETSGARLDAHQFGLGLSESIARPSTGASDLHEAPCRVFGKWLQSRIRICELRLAVEEGGGSEAGRCICHGATARMFPQGRSRDAPGTLAQ